MARVMSRPRLTVVIAAADKAGEAQRILAQNFNRVHDDAITAEFAANFPDVKLVTVEDVFGGWDKVQEEHFAEGGILDSVFVNQ